MSTLPLWKRQLLEKKQRKEAEQRMREQEEFERYGKIPSWKVDLIKRRTSDDRSKSKSTEKLNDKKGTENKTEVELNGHGVVETSSPGASSPLPPVRKNPWIVGDKKSRTKPQTFRSVSTESQYSDQHMSNGILDENDDGSSTASEEENFGPGFVSKRREIFTTSEKSLVSPRRGSPGVGMSVSLEDIASIKPRRSSSDLLSSIDRKTSLERLDVLPENLPKQVIFDSRAFSVNKTTLTTSDTSNMTSPDMYNHKDLHLHSQRDLHDKEPRDSYVITKLRHDSDAAADTSLDKETMIGGSQSNRKSSAVPTDSEEHQAHMMRKASREMKEEELPQPNTVSNTRTLFESENGPAKKRRAPGPPLPIPSAQTLPIRVNSPPPLLSPATHSTPPSVGSILLFNNPNVPLSHHHKPEHISTNLNTDPVKIASSNGNSGFDNDTLSDNLHVKNTNLRQLHNENKSVAKESGKNVDAIDDCDKTVNNHSQPVAPPRRKKHEGDQVDGLNRDTTCILQGENHCGTNGGVAELIEGNDKLSGDETVISQVHEGIKEADGVSSQGDVRDSVSAFCRGHVEDVTVQTNGTDRQTMSNHSTCTKEKGVDETLHCSEDATPAEVTELNPLIEDVKKAWHANEDASWQCERFSRKSGHSSKDMISLNNRFRTEDKKSNSGFGGKKDMISTEALRNIQRAGRSWFFGGTDENLPPGAIFVKVNIRRVKPKPAYAVRNGYMLDVQNNNKANMAPSIYNTQHSKRIVPSHQSETKNDSNLRKDTTTIMVNGEIPVTYIDDLVTTGNQTPVTNIDDLLSSPLVHSQSDSGLQFDGANIIVGKSLISKQKKKNKIKISFSDNCLEKRHEYQSEQSLMQELGLTYDNDDIDFTAPSKDTDTDHSSELESKSSLKSTPSLGGTGDLGNYSSRLAMDYQFGMHFQYEEEKKETKAPPSEQETSQNPEDLQITYADDAYNYSESASSDLLF